ncbi:MAG: methyltransferase domain-containing protein [Pseudomonadota bacterium]
MNRPASETTGDSNASVEDHYDSPALRLGPVLFDDHLHWGYWDKDSQDATFGQAAERMCQEMIARTSISEGEHFVDLGCGIGHPAMRLAQSKNCRVTGVTISGFQRSTAQCKAEEAGLTDHLTFLHSDARKVDAPDASFDGGWFFESIFHMGHADALKEAARLLKPGSELLLTDLPVLDHTTPEFMEFVDEHVHSVFVPAAAYDTLLPEAGFEMLHYEDITENVMPMLVDKLDETLKRNDDAVRSAMGEEADKAIDNWLYLFEYMSENLGYSFIRARRL